MVPRAVSTDGRSARCSRDRTCGRERAGVQVVGGVQVEAVLLLEGRRSSVGLKMLPWLCWKRQLEMARLEVASNALPADARS